MVTEGLRPLADCKSLTEIQLDRRLHTEDYSCLSVKLPSVECEEFAPYVKLQAPDYNGKDTLVIGHR